MSIHISRDNQLKGVGAPTISPSYYGQSYVDTGTNPRGIWMSTSENVSGWVELSPKGHKHTAADFTDLTTEITKIVQSQGIEAALLSLKGGTNTWEGAWNNFVGDLRQNGKKVLTQGSSIGDLGDVNITTGLKANALLGWNGSEFIPYVVSGASPSDGGIDFSKYLKKDSLVTGIGSGDQTAPLAASVATLLYNRVKAEFAAKNHTHTEYAPASHSHKNYLDITKPSALRNQLNLGGAAGNNMPLTITGPHGRVAFEFSENPAGATILSFHNTTGGSALTEAMISGADGSPGGRLTLNFSEIHVPSGGLTIGENKKYISTPPIRLKTDGHTYIGETSRTFGFDLNNSALIGASQIAFKTPSRGRANSILFPKNYAGNTQPADIGLYHYLRLLDGEMQTDTALASDAKYIRLGGVKIFFSATDPGKEADDGSIWIKI